MTNNKNYCSYEGNLNWLNFLGDWGNSAEGCEYEIVTGITIKYGRIESPLNILICFFFFKGECELGSGPSGPRSKVDFPDPEPKTSFSLNF